MTNFFRTRTRKNLKLLFILLSFVLVFNLFGLSITKDYVEADAPGYRFSNISILVDGVELPADDLNTRINPNNNVAINFDWEIDNNKDLDGTEILEYILPDIFELGSFDLNGPLENPDGSYGNWNLDVSERKLTVTFSDLPTTQSNVTGTVTLNGEFNLDEKIKSVPYELTLPISGVISKTYKIHLNVPDGTTISKTGEQNDTDANQIDWSVDINTNLNSVDNPEMIDNYDSLLLYKNDSLKIYNLDVKSDGTLIEGVLVNPTEYVINHDSVNDLLNVRFNDSINSAYRIKYSTTVDSAQIDTSKTSFNYTNNVTFNGDSDTDTVTITRAPLLVKEGQLSSLYNAESINWDIKINQSLYNLINPNVVDIIPKGLILDNTSITVKKISDGSSYNPANYTTNSVINGDLTTTLTIDFNTDVSEALLIEYKTNVNSDTKKNNSDILSFSNDVTLSYGPDGSVVEKKDSSTKYLKKGRVVYKTGTSSISYNEDKYILWTLDINTSQINVGLDEISDVLGSGQKLDLGYNGGNVFIINELDIDKGPVDSGTDDSAVETDIYSNITLGSEVSIANYTVVDGSNNPLAGIVTDFKIKFDSNIDKSYRIQYRTIVTDYDISDFENTANVGIYKSEPSVSAPINNTFNKISKGITYGSNILEWEISVNPIKHGMDGFKIVDDFHQDQYMEEATQFDAIIVEENGVPLIKDTDYTINKVIDGDGIIRGFTIDYLNEVNDFVYKVKYKTTVDPKILSTNGNLDYENSVNFTWTGNLVGVTVTKELDIEEELVEIVKHNGIKRGSLDASNKQINWTVDLNYLKKEINNLEVTDDIEGNQRLAADSIKVYTYDVNVDGDIINIVEVVDLVAAGITVIEDVANNNFKVEFPATISTSYRLTYKTNFEGISQTVYTNTAETNKGENYSASVNYSDGNKFVEKSGTLFGVDYVIWEIVLNKSQSTISSITLTDTLGEGMELVEDSFVLKDKSGTILSFDDYFTFNKQDRTLVTDPLVFNLTSKQSINEKMIIEYRADILLDEILENKLTNSIVFEGAEVITGERNDTAIISHTFFTGSGTGVGEVGSFTLTKVDKENPAVKLQGVEFDFYKGDRLLGRLATDVNGEITVERLKYATYKLIEVGAPDGYIMENETTTFDINSTVKRNIIVENKKLKTLKIKKINEDNTDIVLQGAEFEIYDSTDALVDTVTTDGTGYALKGLDNGNYKIKEIKAPSGYYLNTEEHNVTIDNSATEFEVIISNKRMPLPAGGAIPQPEPEPEPEPEPDKVIVKTPEKTPTGGKVDVKKGSNVGLKEPPKNGTAKITDKGEWTYTPKPDFKGVDSFKITVKDEEGTERIIEIEIDVEKMTLVPNVLPQTGDSVKWLNYITGIMIMLVGIILLWYNRRKNT